MRRGAAPSPLGVLLLVLLGCAAAGTTGTGAPSPPAPSPPAPTPATERYLLYVPHMGRFGNQVELLLGALHFAEQVDRALVVPPFIGYGPVALTPFESLFSLAHLRQHHPRAVPLERFLEDAAAWPEEERLVFCSPAEFVPADRSGGALDDGAGSPASCPMNEQVGARHMWASHAVVFQGAREHPFLFDDADVPAWEATLRPHRVVALSTAPGLATYPMSPGLEPLQAALVWQPPIHIRATQLLEETYPSAQAVVALHLRAGTDWVCACHREGIGAEQFLSSAQCGERGSVTQDMCVPCLDTLVSQTTQAVRNAARPALVYIGSDCPTCARELADALLAAPDRPGNLVEVLDSQESMAVDLAVFTAADHFLGNCMSSFTAFAVRARRHHPGSRPPPAFWGVTDDHHWHSREGHPTAPGEACALPDAGEAPEAGRGTHVGSLYDGMERDEAEATPISELASPHTTTVVQGSLLIVGSDAEDLGAWQAIEHVDGDVTIEANEELHVISLPKLRTVTGTLFVGFGNTRVDVVELPALECVGRLEVLDADASIVELPGLERVAGDLVVRGCPRLKVLDLPRLQRVEGSVTISDHLRLHDLNVPRLGVVEGFLAVSNNAELPAIALPQLMEVRSFVELYRNDALLRLSLSALDEVGGVLHLAYSPALESVAQLEASTPVLQVVPKPGFPFTLDLRGCSPKLCELPGYLAWPGPKRCS